MKSIEMVALDRMGMPGSLEYDSHFLGYPGGENAHDIAEPQLEVFVAGGGTGASRLVSGIREALPDAYITEAVAVSDDAGSSRRISEVLDIPPPGDVRQAVGAAAADPAATELWHHRLDGQSTPADVWRLAHAFTDAVSTGPNAAHSKEDRLRDLADATGSIAGNFETLAGHPIGNLVLAAASREAGSLSAGTAAVVDAMGIRNADVVPVSDQRHQLVLLRDGKPVIVGQSAIDAAVLHMPFDGLTVGYTLDMRNYNQPGSRLDPAAVELCELPAHPLLVKRAGSAAIAATGVGSWLTSNAPVLQAHGLRQAIEANHQAVVAAIPNLVQAKGQQYTDSWSMAANIRAVHAALGRVDVVVANSTAGNGVVLRQAGLEPIAYDDQADRLIEELAASGVRAAVRLGNLAIVGNGKSTANDQLAAKRSPVLHDSQQVARMLRAYVQK